MINIMVFMNPEDLSYHNFENILDLDNFIKLNLNLKKEKLPSLGKELLKIDELNLYNLTFNNDSRGRKRCIFKSDFLSNILTKIIKNINIFQNEKFLRL